MHHNIISKSNLLIQLEKKLEKRGKRNKGQERKKKV